MEYTLVDGRSLPEAGDRIRIRVLRDESGNLAVDRPHRDLPLKLNAGDGISIPDDVGTYEVRGTVIKTGKRGQDGNPDHLFVDHHHVERVSDELVELSEGETPAWEDIDSSDVDVDVDVDLVTAEDTIVEQTDSRSTLSGSGSDGKNLNDLLLGTQ